MTCWSFRLCADTTEFWLEELQSIQEFVPETVLEEFFTTFDTKDTYIDLSYMTATLSHGWNQVKVFGLDKYISSIYKDIPKL